MASLFTEALLVSVYANSEALLICLAGAVAMYCNVAQPSDLKSFSKLLVKIVFPCLTFSNFRVYSVELLAKWYVASVASLLTLALGASVGKLSAKLLRLPQPYSQILVLCTTFGNVGALPYVLIPPIVLNWQRVSDDPNALLKGYGIISLYAIVWGLALFGLGPKFIESMRSAVVTAKPASVPASPSDPPSADSSGPTPTPAPSEALEAAGRIRVKSAVRRAWRIACSLEPVILGSLLGIVVGMIAPLRQLLSPSEGGALRFVGSFATNLGSAGIPLSTLILGASLFLGGRGQWQARRERLVSSANGPAASNGSAAANGYGSAASGVASAEDVVVEHGRSQQVKSSPMARLLWAALVIKLLLMPAVSIPIILLAARSNLLARDEPMLLMVLILQSAVPSAQTGLALMNAAGLQKEASQMSMVYLPMYIISVITVAASIVIAVTGIETLYDDVALLGPGNATSAASS